MTPLLWAAAAFLILLGLYEWRLSRDPVYEGKRVSEWVDLACGPYGDAYCDKIPEIGSPAVPYLIAKAKSGDLKLGKLWTKIRDRLPSAIADSLPEGTDGSSPRLEAIVCLASLGPKAKPAVPVLIKLLRDTNEDTLEFAAFALAEIGPDAATALPRLKQTLTNATPREQIAIASALWKIGRETNEVLRIYDGLIKLITLHRGWIFAGSALDGLGDMRSAASPEVPVLIQLLGNKGSDTSERTSAVRTLRRINLKSDQLVAALQIGMQDTNREVSISCAMCLWTWDRNYAQPAISLILTYLVELNKKHPGYQRKFRLPPIAEVDPNYYITNAIPVLKELAHSDDSEIRHLAADALADIESSNPNRYNSNPPK